VTSRNDVGRQERRVRTIDPVAVSNAADREGAMTQPETDVLRTAYDAFNRRDIDVGVALMAPDVEWPNAVTGGFVHGREEVRKHWQEQFERVDPRIEVGRVSRRPDGRFAAHVRQVVRGHDGEPISDDQLVHVFAIDNRLITRMDIELPD
jgi:ketosteroid isomerase-like protein